MNKWNAVLIASCVLSFLSSGKFAHAADELERLIPWQSLGGVPHPDEANLESANWTTLAHQSLAPRLVQNLNSDWTFNYFPAEKLDLALLAPTAEDRKWPIIALPHTWHTFETTRQMHPFIATPSEHISNYWWHGWGIYRKEFTLDSKIVSGRRVFVEFDGVMKYCRVWLNGVEIGDHKGGYSSFYFDMTPHLKEGSNSLCIAVSARRDDEFKIPPMNAGNFDVYGGIYRDVRLVVKSAVHIPFQGSSKHEGGTFVTTPEVSLQQATVRVRTWVKNESTIPQTVVLRTLVLDPAARQVAQDEVRAELAPGALHAFDQPKIAVSNPQLWSIESPQLYSVQSEVRVGDVVQDRLVSPLGLRWFEWNKVENRGYLNGMPLHIHGTNRHQEFPWLGDAVPKWIHVRDMAEIRFGQGHNFLRTAHYPNDSLVYDLADRYGILICEEVPNIKDIKFDDAMQKQQVIEMVRRDRNHPSIVMWSMGNETSDPADSAWAHAEDDTRLIHLRRSNAKKGGTFVTHTHEDMDMENLLRCTIRGWTHRDVANFQPANGQQAGTEDWQCAQALVQDGSQRGRIDMPNGVMWIYADHGADRQKYLNCPLLNVNPKGWTDLYRIPKYMYFLWQANYLPEPMVFVQPHFWQTQYIGKSHNFVVHSNCDSVELFVNGRSIGVQACTAENFRTVTFAAVLVERGELRVVGKKGEKSVTRVVQMAGEPARLTLSASQAELKAGRDSIAVLNVDALDDKGVPAPEFRRDLKWKVSGPATLLTPETYTSDLKKNLSTTGCFYIVAPVCALVRSTGEAGQIIVTVSADGVASASVKITTKLPPAQSGLFASSAPLTLDNREAIPTIPVIVVAPGIGKRKGGAAHAPAVLKTVAEDVVMPGGKDVAFYKAEVQKWFSQNDPDIVKRSSFGELASVFVDHLAANKGLMVADDFNHRAEQFNAACTLDEAVAARHLPKAYALALTHYFAHRLIRIGESLQIDEEEKWISALPVDAKEEVLKQGTSSQELFNQWYPEAALLPASQREAALRRFEDINQGSGTPHFDPKVKQPIKYAPKAALLKPSFVLLQTSPQGK